MKISVEIDDDVYNFLESKSINVGRLIQTFVTRVSYLVQESNCIKKVSKEMDYSNIAGMMKRVAMGLDRESKNISVRSRMESNKLKEKRIKHQKDSKHL